MEHTSLTALPSLTANNMAHSTMQISEELDVDIVPGTEIMADVGSHHFVKSKSCSNLVLVPQPDNSPHDPLVNQSRALDLHDSNNFSQNWSPFWKGSAIFCTTLNSFAQGLGPLALAPVFPELMQTFDCTLPQAIQFTSVTIIVLGFSNFLW